MLLVRIRWGYRTRKSEQRIEGKLSQKKLRMVDPHKGDSLRAVWSLKQKQQIFYLEEALDDDAMV